MNVYPYNFRCSNVHHNRAGIWGSVVSGQGRHTSQRRQQACIYVNPPEKHCLMQPLIMVVQQHWCMVHG